jgi:hypothetical protein
MESFTNIALFIKRAEIHHDTNFITKAFADNKIGSVKEVQFIKKTNDNGKEYNGVIVIFEKWEHNQLVKNLISQMNSSKDGTTRFYFNNSQYWFIKIHTSKAVIHEEHVTVDKSLPDKQRIEELEKLVKSMATQIHFMELRQERSEQSMMEYEHKHIQNHLYNSELKTQVDLKEMERKWTEEDFNEEIKKLKEENMQLRCRLSCVSIDLSRKELECKKLLQELQDEQTVVNYKENQTQEMKQLLQAVSVNDPSKDNIVRYIKECMY